MKISSLSTEYVRTKVTSEDDPTIHPVHFAFMAPGEEPAEGDWKAGSWQLGASTPTARCLVGPGPGAAVALADGTYKVWLRITANPEIPIVQFDTLKVT